MFQHLFGRRNPTRGWPPNAGAGVTFDIDEAALDHVRHGEPLVRLAFLGPDEVRGSFRKGELLYPSRGLSVRFDPERQSIVEYRIVQDDPQDRRFRSFLGAVLLNGRPVDLSVLSINHFVRALGAPYWRDRDDEESILFFESPGLEWQIEFSPDDRLRCITVTSEPILESAEQRAAYGVTAPWPPPSHRTIVK